MKGRGLAASALLSALIHPSAWKENSQTSISTILHKSRWKETLWLSETRLRREGDHNFWCRGYKSKITNAAFVAA